MPDLDRELVPEEQAPLPSPGCVPLRRRVEVRVEEGLPSLLQEVYLPRPRLLPSFPDIHFMWRLVEVGGCGPTLTAVVIDLNTQVPC